MFSLRGIFLELFQKLVAFLFVVVVLCFLCSTVLSSKWELFFSPYWHSNPAKKYASWDNAASLLWKPYFILSLQSEREKHKGVGIIECKGLQQTSPLSSLAGIPFLYFPFYSFCLPLLKGSCWVWAACLNLDWISISGNGTPISTR